VPRHNLIALLRQHRPADPAEAEMLLRTLDFTEREPLSLHPEFAPGHVTASAWVIDGDSVLLTHHRKLDRWFQLGGHLDPGETVLEGSLREAREESGLEEIRAVREDVFDVDVHPIPERGAVAAHFHYDIRFLLEASSAAVLVASSESRSLAWVPLGEVHRYNSSESILRMVRKSLNSRCS
jgi:8-oxo-dGTP pyrophosphatase MutT (NUDIX family)